MNARTQSFVLFLFGGALLRLAAGDALVRYVRPVARPYVLAAGIAIVVLAVWTILAPLHHREAQHQPDGPDVDAHGHRGASRAAWLVMAPVVAILVVAPPALGSYSAARTKATIARPSDVAFPPLPAGDPADVKLLDYATRALWDDGRTLAHRSVRLTGFVLSRADGRFTLARLVITCCAADAQAIEIAIRDAASAPAKNAWVAVTGTYASSPTGSTLPVLVATAVQPITQPANPYD